MDFILGIILFVLLYIFFILPVIKRLREAYNKLINLLNASHFPAVGFDHFESLNREIEFWNEKQKKYHNPPLIFKESKEQEKNRDSLWDGCNNILYLYWQLYKKAQEANIDVLNGKKNIEKASDEYSDFWSEQLDKIFEERRKLKKLDKKLEDEIIKKELDEEFGGG